MKIIVQEYGLDAFVKKVSELASQGYEPDMTSNEGYPRQIGVVYTVTMLKGDVETKVEHTEDVAPVKRGRKAG
jgi:hypothetical protein